MLHYITFSNSLFCKLFRYKFPYNFNQSLYVKPSYVTFKQAKWLFEKGFNIFTKDTKSLIIDNRYGNNEHYSFYKDATEWNIDLSIFPEFKKRCIITFHEKVGTNSSEMSTLLVMYNLVKGGDNGGIKSYLAPEQWQVVEWLELITKFGYQ